MSVTESATIGDVLTQLQQGPVTIERAGSPVAMVVGMREYQRFMELQREQEDHYWGEMAMRAKEKNDFASDEEMQSLMERFKGTEESES